MPFTSEKKSARFIKTLILTTLLLIVGCTVKPYNVKSPIAPPEKFSASGDQVLPDKWWLALEDPQLNDLIDEALTDNFTIRIAWDRLTQAQQVAKRVGANLFPFLDYSGTAKRTRQNTGSTTTYTSDFSAALVLSYEVDLWGQIRSAHQAAIFDAAAAYEDVYAAAISLSAAIAKTWYQLAAAAQTENILSQQVRTNKQVLDLITARFRKGQVTAADVYRQKQLVEATNGKLIQAKEDIVLLRHQLNVLLGKSPGTPLSAEQIELIDLPKFPQTPLPIELLKRRPDVISAFRDIQAANQRVAVAIADQYPAIRISSTAQTSAEKVHDLFDDWLANLAANAVGPLFDAGFTKAEIKRTKAVLSQRINNYGQTVLNAFKEVEDAIAQERYQELYVENLNKQLTLAQQVYQRTEQSYLKGMLDYLRVLDSLVSRQNLEINELAAREILLERRIDLYKAIAGRWEIARPQPNICIDENESK